MDVVFVHGALVRDGSWWWHRAAEAIQRRTGMSSRSLALPSCGETAPEAMVGGLKADAAALRAQLDETAAAIVVGHSYGGTVIAEAGSHPAIAALVYISSYLPEIGQSQAAIMSGESDPVRIRPRTDGPLEIGALEVDGYDEATFAQRFLHDASDADQREGWSRVTPQAAAAFTTPTTHAGWRGLDSTYLVCTDDRSTSVALQRAHAERATRSVDVETGHHPFLSAPELVADQIEAICLRLNAA